MVIDQEKIKVHLRISPSFVSPQATSGCERPSHTLADRPRTASLTRVPRVIASIRDFAVREVA